MMINSDRKVRLFTSANYLRGQTVGGRASSHLHNCRLAQTSANTICEHMNFLFFNDNGGTVCHSLIRFATHLRLQVSINYTSA